MESAVRANDEAPLTDSVHSRSHSPCRAWDSALPRWFTVALTGALVFVGTAGLSGIALLMVHGYQPLAVFGLATSAGVGSAVVVARTSERNSAASRGPVIAAVGVALIFFAITGVRHSEHLLTDRDPGVYMNTGRSIAGRHTLTPVVRSGPFDDLKFVVSSQGFFQASGKQESWFLPMLPVLLALGWSAGGYTGLFAVGPLLGALGLLVCYALAARLVGPRWALLVPALLAVNPLQTWFARDAYSELVVQVVALGGIWLYLEARAVVSPRIAAISGALIATSVLARFDALAIVACLVGFAALEWTRCDDAERPQVMRRVVAAFGLVLLAATLYFSVMTYSTSRSYLDWHGTSTRPLHLMLLASIVLATVWIAANRLHPGFGRRLAQARLPFAIGCAFVMAACVWAYVWRPSDPAAAFPVSSIMTAVPNHQAWSSAHWTWSMRWFVDWFGISAVVLGVLGFLSLSRRALRGSVAATVVVVVAVPLAILYLWRPSVAPDQPWAMRRYLPVVIPGLVIAVVIALHGLTGFARRFRERRRRMPAYLAIVALALAVFTQSAVAAVPLVGARAQHGALTAVKKVCNELPSDAAVLVYPASFLDNEMAQTIRGFCEVPTAAAPTEPDLDIASLARAWSNAGRGLYILTASPEKLVNATASDAVVLHLEIDDRYDPQYTYRVRPERYEQQPRQFWLLRVAATSKAP
ncbi:MAG: hypothetical protein M3Q30_03075 [Actinomycetota bacterium]|nr:hypothetical protein [Actinomycetota bacterium]